MQSPFGAAGWGEVANDAWQSEGVAPDEMRKRNMRHASCHDHRCCIVSGPPDVSGLMIMFDGQAFLKQLRLCGGVEVAAHIDVTKTIIITLALRCLFCTSCSHGRRSGLRTSVGSAANAMPELVMGVVMFCIMIHYLASASLAAGPWYCFIALLF